jgi:hypothetical protein
MLAEVSFHIWMHKRAAKKVYRLFGCNKLEMDFLLCVAAAMNCNDQAIIRVSEIVDKLTARKPEKTRLQQHCFHCVRKGFLGSYEYVSNPGSKSVGFTPLGIECLKAYMNALSELSGKFCPCDLDLEKIRIKTLKRSHSRYIERKVAA